VTPSLLPLGLPEARPPCLSIYQPTHRSFPDRQQDPIRFRNHIRALDASLRQRHDAAMVDALLAPLHDLAADARFWTQTLDGLAVMASPAGMRWWRLQRPVPEVAIAARSWHLKPLLRILQSADRFQVLALTRHTVRLIEGNRDVLDEIELHPDVPRSPGDVPAAVPTGSQQDIDVATGQAGAEYAYDVSPVAIAPHPAGQFATNGLTDLLAIGDRQFIGIERSFAIGAQTPGTPVTGNTIRLFYIDARHATDIAGRESIAGDDSVVAASKELLLDLSTLRNDDGSALALDNIEGLTLGPVVNGQQTLVLVSDNNFSGTQFTQFVALQVSQVPEPKTWAMLIGGLCALLGLGRKPGR